MTGGNRALRSSLGSLNSAVTAGGSITADGYNGATVTADAGGDVTVTSAASATANVTAADNVTVSALNSASADIVYASGDLSIFAGGSATADGAIAGNASVFAGTSLAGDLIAGGDVSALALGSFTLDIFASGGGGVSAFAASAMSGVSLASSAGSVDVSVWDNITGLDVNAYSGASVFAYGTFDGSLTSAADATLFTGGSATLSALDVAGEATIETLADFDGTFNTPGSVTLTAAGNVTGSFAAAGDLSIDAGGDIVTTAGSLAAGNNLSLTSGGSIFTDTVTAGHDLHMSAGHDIAVALAGGVGATAGHDITSLHAGGAITSGGGVFHAANSVDTVTSYKLIDVDLSAGTGETDTGELTFGLINLVESWGNINGAFTAEEEIETISTAGTFTGSAMAAGGANVNANDQQVAAGQSSEADDNNSEPKSHTLAAAKADLLDSVSKSESELAKQTVTQSVGQIKNSNTALDISTAVMHAVEHVNNLAIVFANSANGRLESSHSKSYKASDDAAVSTNKVINSIRAGAIPPENTHVSSLEQKTAENEQQRDASNAAADLALQNLSDKVQLTRDGAITELSTLKERLKAIDNDIDFLKQVSANTYRALLNAWDGKWFAGVGKHGLTAPPANNPVAIGGLLTIASSYGILFDYAEWLNRMGGRVKLDIMKGLKVPYYTSSATKFLGGAMAFIDTYNAYSAVQDGRYGDFIHHGSFAILNTMAMFTPLAAAGSLVGGTGTFIIEEHTNAEVMLFNKAAQVDIVNRLMMDARSLAAQWANLLNQRDEIIRRIAILEATIPWMD